MFDSLDVYYNKEMKYFEDSDGEPIQNIYELVKNSDVYLFMYKKAEMSVRHRYTPNISVTLHYPEEE